MKWKKLKYDMITRWGGYEKQCGMVVSYAGDLVPETFEQINGYLLKYTSQKNINWHVYEMTEGEW